MKRCLQTQETENTKDLNPFKDGNGVTDLLSKLRWYNLTIVVPLVTQI
ncbi:hypothetical protein [Winogradskyella ludwigii]|nr:hypothetical protein [Winogradskyella ludwigii]